MLTHQSITVSRLRILLLALVSVVVFSNTGFSQKTEQKSIIISFNGNQFEIYPGHCDTTIIVDSFTGSEKFLVSSSDPYPIKMNGNKIYYFEELNNKIIFQSKDSTLEEYMTEKIEKDLIKLPDCSYYFKVCNIVIDEKGKLV